MSQKHVSKIGYGGARLGSLSSPLGMRDCARLLDAAIDNGITFFDTANIYGQGDSERMIGQAIRHDRERFSVTTKAGQRFSRKMRLIRPFKPLMKLLPLSSPKARKAVVAQRARNIGPAFQADGLQAELEGSLRRLRTDYVDFFLLHSPSADDLKDGRLFESLERIRARGLARRVGVSCDHAEVALAALEGECISVIQLPILEMERLRPTVTARDIFVSARGVVRSRGTRSVHQTYRDAVEDPVVGTALVDTTSEKHLRELADLL